MIEIEAFASTRELANLLGVRPSSLSKAVYEGRLTAPQRGPGNAYLWTRRDAERAAWVLCRQPLEDIERRAEAR